MTTLSKLRFNGRTPVPPPSDQPTSSRFSVDSAEPASPIKTPRKPSFSHNWFSSSSSSSPPTSPTRTSKYGHQASASGSKLTLEISSPSKPMRGTGDDTDEEVLNSASDDGKAPVKIVASVEDAFRHARGHSRTGSGTSGKSGASSSRALASSPTPSRTRISRSFSSPARPPRPSREVPPPPCIPRAELPPRSDSRNGYIAPGPVARLFAAEIESRSATPSPSHPVRPHIPPFVDTPPLTVLPRSSPDSTIVPSPPTLAPFRASLIRAPSSRSVANGVDGLLVSLDVGGRKFVTVAATLLQDGRGGKVGEFVESVIEQVRATDAKRAEERRQDSAESIYPASEVSANHFEMSPFPSPFPFSSYDSSDDDFAAALSLDRDSTTLILPSAPGSPIDPYAQKLFINLPPPPLSIPGGHHAEFVSSPLPHLRVTSVVPSICPTPSPTHSSSSSTPSQSQSIYCPLPLAPRPTPSSHNPAADSDGDSDDEDDQWAPSSAHLSARKSDLNPFVTFVGPFFSVLKNQRRTQIGPDGVEVTFGGPEARESTGLPTDVFSAEEDQSRSTLLGIPRGDGRVRALGPRAMRKLPPVPRLEVVRSETGSRPPSLSMSCSSDEGAALGQKYEEEGEGEEDRGMEVFLDRDGAVYGAVLAFLRDGTLSADYSLPTTATNRSSSSTSSIDPTALSLFVLHPPLALSLLASLRNLTTEATWLGLDALVEACEHERARVIEVIQWLEEKKRREGVEEERRRRAEVMAAREKAGWI